MTKISPVLKLKSLRENISLARSVGLTESHILKLMESYPELVAAIEAAYKEIPELKQRCPDLFKIPEKDLIPQLQGDFLNFYDPASVTPYIPAAAHGPWVVSAYGAVIYDTGGYGMLGFGHSPVFVREALEDDLVMANIMTASVSQYAFSKKLRSMVGFTRPDKTCPFSHFVALNSGSEAMSVASRISDAHAKLMTDPGAKHAGKTIKFLSLTGSFHGRTERPAQVSSSSRKKYEAALASFRNFDKLITVEPNDCNGLRQAFDDAARNNIFIEAMFLEPVMGEGNPGMSTTVEYYNLARELTRAHDTLLIVDSIQAGLRAQGVLSIVDYPGFERSSAPDMESYSKAINAGQFPLSILALTSKAALLYKPGIYGNTMTSNPRALNVALAVLEQITPALTTNIRERGNELLQKLSLLQKDCPGLVIKVQGTGLLLSAQLCEGLAVEGSGGVEEYLRLNGLNVIHGGKNALRFTPHFRITSAEIDLIVSLTRDAINTMASKALPKHETQCCKSACA